MNLLEPFTASPELLKNLVLREVRGQYKRTVLGNFWSLLNPLATMLIYTIVFGLLLKVDPERGNPSGLDIFALWLMVGLIPWTFFSRALTNGMGAIVDNVNLVQKVYFPRHLLVTSTILAASVTFGFEMFALVVVLLVVGGMPLPWIPVALIFMALLTLLALGLGWILGVANVYFRDTQHLVGLLLQFWFYATPILYPLHLVSGFEAELKADGIFLPITLVFELNPMERFTQVFRSLLYDNTWPAADDALFCVVSAVVSAVVGYAVFKRYSGRVAEEL